ncbi:LmeA family phospholipid-binding protein [Streptomyces botrytidirepellens]|uniref:LmeA family phospholipid-binding protein n=1 Tax=Streptomyces botrytidirepellens TaxID=2486417 RepID=UPI001FE32CF5|nr:DUF2993 domain-containing protein [Streptomyces botrytidirepellens]
MRSPTRISSPRPHNSHRESYSDDSRGAARRDAENAAHRHADDAAAQHEARHDADRDAPSAPYSNPYEELAELADPYDPDDPLGLGLKPDDDDTSDLGSAGGKDGVNGEEGEPWSPPDHGRSRRGRRRGRGRFKAVPLTAKAVIGVLVLAALAVLADRCAVMYVERKAEAALQKKLKLATAPNVTIHGFPFLTQVVDKKLTQVDVAVPDVAADRVSLAEVNVQAQDIRLNADLPTSIKGAVVDRMKGDVLLAFEDLDRELGASQVRFRAFGPNSVRADGKLPVAGQNVSLHAMAHIQRQGDRGISTEVTGMRLEIPGIATYRPGKNAGLRLHPKAAKQISEDTAKARALLEVPSVAERLGIAPEPAGRARQDDKQLDKITGSPSFVPALTKVNLVDVTNEHPELVKKLGIDPTVAAALTKYKLPELSEKLSLSFQLPEKAKDIKIQNIGVEPDGIVADLTGTRMGFGKRP